ncbi:hypothetical protein [Woodsholea maritima]|uniref:hypothetical protein n=1 Tax=Woodsholea maritima TaxID=240237 RepID=UPI000369894C|nr:hypothetical protein [Woodsholea maritima]
MASRFHIAHYHWDAASASVTFDYVCDRYGAFSETIRFAREDFHPERLEAAPGLIRLAQALIGVSYYKAAAAPELILPDEVLSAQSLGAIEAAYQDGLGEFRVRNGLAHPGVLSLVGRAKTGQGCDKLALNQEHALVAWGGGKDSAVVRHFVTRAGIAARVYSVATSDRVKDVLQDTAGGTLNFIDRRIDPRLIAANEAGALNGHVPVTAINSILLSLAAVMRGAGQVVFANERSADEPTLVMDGAGVNHQYSKSYAFEALLRAALASETGGALSYYSALRPVSEIWIARQITGLDDVARITSCNRNFHIAKGADTRWCRTCPKCAFTFLIFAPFLARDRAELIFGGNLLADTGLIPLYEEILGFGTQKPWECVGTIEEARTALSLLQTRPDWQDVALVRHFAPRLSDFDRDGHYKALLEFKDPHHLPDGLLQEMMHG